MADNMIELVAKLNTDESEAQIKKDLNIISKALGADSLKISCSIDQNSIKKIQSQIDNLSRGIKLNIGTVGNGKINNIVDEKAIKNQAKALTDALDLALPKGKVKETRDVIQGLINDYQKAFNSGDYNKKTSSFDALEKYVGQFRKEIHEINYELVETQQNVNAIAKKGKTFINDSDFKELSYLLGGDANARNLLGQAFGVGKDSGWTRDRSKSTISWDMKVQAINDLFASSRYDKLNEIDSGKFNDHIDGVIQLVNYLNKSFDQGDELVSQYGQEIQKQFGDQLYSELNKVLGISTQIDNEWEEIFNPNEVQETTQEVQKLGNELQQTLSKYPDISVGANTKSTLNNAKNILNEYFNASGLDGEANRVKRAIEDTEGELQRFYVQVERGDKSVETLTYALNEQGNAYEYLGKTIREADNSTDFRRKDITTQWDIQTQKLQQFITNAEKAGAASTVLSDDIANLKSKLDSKGDTSAMNSFLDDFDIAKAKFQAFNAEVRKDNAITNFNNKIKKLSADMNAYATTNQRAVESTKKMTSGTTFADEWVRLTGLMAKGANLTDTELRNLIADMAVFKKESKSAGLEGASAFERFANSFKVISTYISANQIINRVISQIREGITELKEIDNILTEISKTSDRTTESLRRLGQASFDVASNYGRTASDYLLGVQEMSRAGFGEAQSEQLAELSLRAQAAGDMTAEMANQYIIATNAAYALAGNEDKLNRVLDSQNYITNHNAVNMENLAQATKIAASQASASGVAIDELTAAVGTMVAVTQQGGDQAGRAFKGILMNIQQVKASAADIGDGGEDITTESLSKYEKATAALGVSLKEVRNGTLQLREPMEVLRDLSEAVRKESEGSIKVANLISAVGGKFRGNQLIALLQNWETYEKMLSEFNSDNAIGSAMDEAEKSANNWAGSINKVKNSWAELTSKFADSDNMISIINSINAIIQSLSDSATTGALRTLSEAFTGVFKAVSFLTDKLGALPTLLTTIATINSIRGKGIFGGESIDSLSGAIQTANGSLKKYLVSLDAAKLKTIALRAATVAFEAALTLGITWAISKLIEAYDKFANAEERFLEQQKQAHQEVMERVRAYSDEINENKDLSASYIELISTTSDLTSEKEKLLEIQEKINNGIENQTDKVDLLNKSLSENIELTSKQRLKEAEKIISENQATYENVIKGENASYVAMQTYGDRDVAKAISEIEYVTGRRISGTLKEQSQQLEEILKLYHDIDGYNKQYYNDVVKGKQAIDATLSEWAEIKDVVESARKTVQELTISPETQESFNGLVDKAKQLYDELNNTSGTSQEFVFFKQLEDVRTELQELASNNSELSQIVDNLFASFDNGLDSISNDANNFREVWFNTLNDMQKGVLSNVDKIKSAMQSLAEGEQLTSGDFWELMSFDTNKVITDIQMVDDKFVITQEQLIELKDQIIQKELDSIKAQRERAELDRQNTANLVSFYEQQKAAWKFAEKPLTNIQYRKEYDNLNAKLEQAKAKAAEYGDEVYRDIILERQLSASLGDTVDTLKALTAQQKQLNNEISTLNKQLDNYVNAYNSIIDSRIDGLQDEVDVLEEQKGILEDELNALNEQKDSLDQIINDYQSINSIVQDTVQKEIDSLNEQKKAIEDTYNKRIEALKTENEEREDALEYAQKLANLENAKNNKVRVIDATRGFRYESVKEDVVQAENDLKSFETEQAIKKLESERDTEAKVFDDLIKQREEYAKLWQNGIDSIQEAQNDLLMSEKYGADWREKIAAGDTEILDAFILSYREHNNALKNLTDNEIKMKQAAIATKNAEIDSKKKQIKSWQDYKTQVSKAIQTLKGDQSEYKGIIEDLERTEPLTLETRGNAFETFKTRISGYISEIGSKQGVLNDITSTIDSLSGGDYQFNFEVNNLDVLKETRDIIEDIAAASGYLSVTSMSTEDLQNKWITDPDFTTADYVQELLRRKGRSHAAGGVADYTGLAMLHGRKNAPETIFNANDSAKLYEMVHNTPNLMADMIAKATKVSGFNLAKTSGDTQNSNEYSFYIDKIVTDSPENFAKQLDRYYQTKLTKSYTNK